MKKALNEDGRERKVNWQFQHTWQVPWGFRKEGESRNSVFSYKIKTIITKFLRIIFKVDFFLSCIKHTVQKNAVGRGDIKDGENPACSSFAALGAQAWPFSGSKRLTWGQKSKCCDSCCLHLKYRKKSRHEKPFINSRRKSERRPKRNGKPTQLQARNWGCFCSQRSSCLDTPVTGDGQLKNHRPCEWSKVGSRRLFSSSWASTELRVGIFVYLQWLFGYLSSPELDMQCLTFHLLSNNTLKVPISDFSGNWSARGILPNA